VGSQDRSLPALSDENLLPVRCRHQAEQITQVPPVRPVVRVAEELDWLLEVLVQVAVPAELEAVAMVDFEG
jgi:hypothetical protein